MEESDLIKNVIEYKSFCLFVCLCVCMFVVEKLVVVFPF